MCQKESKCGITCLRVFYGMVGGSKQRTFQVYDPGRERLTRLAKWGEEWSGAPVNMIYCGPRRAFLMCQEGLSRALNQGKSRARRKLRYFHIWDAFLRGKRRFFQLFQLVPWRLARLKSSGAKSQFLPSFTSDARRCLSWVWNPRLTIFASLFSSGQIGFMIFSFLWRARMPLKLLVPQTPVRHLWSFSFLLGARVIQRGRETRHLKKRCTQTFSLFFTDRSCSFFSRLAKKPPRALSMAARVDFAYCWTCFTKVFWGGWKQLIMSNYGGKRERNAQKVFFFEGRTFFQGQEMLKEWEEAINRSFTPRYIHVIFMFQKKRNKNISHTRHNFPHISIKTRGNKRLISAAGETDESKRVLGI